MNKYLLLALFTILFLQCTSEVEPEQTSIYGFESSQDAREHIGNYALVNELTNGSLILSSEYYGLGSSEQHTFFAKYVEDRLEQGNRIDGGNYHINEIELKWNGEIYHPTGITPQLSYPFVQNLFGANQSILLKRNESNIINETFYFPEQLEILNLSLNNLLPNTNAIGISRSSFQLEWNEDTLNMNGILLYVNWRGQTIGNGGNQTFTSQMERAIVIPDTGFSHIPSSLFDGIPKDALVTLLVSRANVKIIESSSQGETYKLIANQLHYLNIGLLD